ncbi:MAG TPA: NAD-dependent epimerase/dehydratase family protein [Deltaproteobacteria bacterium]|nr:NAD-dependent epimerase/dehydratase family protein [Deltaproteobacteria bacterium]
MGAVTGKRCLVTGATGFMGRRLTALLLERGAAVRALVRSRERARAVLPAGGVELVEGDMTDRAAVERAADGMETVFHLATADPRSDPHFDATNVKGMETVVSVLEERGPRRIVYTGSSVALSAGRSRYGESKRREAGILTSSKLDYTVIIPSQVFGEGYDKNINRLLALIRRLPVVLVLGDGRYRLQPVYAGDVVEALLLAARSERAVGRSYFIAGPEAVSFNDLVDRAARAMGLRRRRVHVPLWLVKAPALLLEKVFAGAPVTAEKIERAVRDNTFDIEAARRDLGYRPTPLDEALARTVGERRPS